MFRTYNNIVKVDLSTCALRDFFLYNFGRVGGNIERRNIHKIKDTSNIENGYIKFSIKMSHLITIFFIFKIPSFSMFL